MKVVICFLITLLVLMYFYIYYYLQVFRNNKCVFFVSQVSTNTNWDFVNKIIYINLEERTDRRQEIEQELKNVNIPLHKIFRLNAIHDSHGNIGCSKSHILALEIAMKNEWKNVLIMEDDAMWNKFEKGYELFKQLVQEHPDFDVITLGNTFPTFDKDTYRLYDGQTCTSYLVNSSYYKILHANFEEGLKNLKFTKTMKTNKDRFTYEQKYCVDQYWKILQKKDIWYIVNPALMIQRPSKSNILDANVDYTSYFNL